MAFGKKKENKWFDEGAKWKQQIVNYKYKK